MQCIQLGVIITEASNEKLTINERLVFCSTMSTVASPLDLCITVMHNPLICCDEGLALESSVSAAFFCDDLVDDNKFVSTTLQLTLAYYSKSFLTNLYVSRTHHIDTTIKSGD